MHAVRPLIIKILARHCALVRGTPIGYHSLGINLEGVRSHARKVAPCYVDIDRNNLYIKAKILSYSTVFYSYSFILTLALNNIEV